MDQLILEPRIQPHNPILINQPRREVNQTKKGRKIVAKKP
jgi:hypothetical protein